MITFQPKFNNVNFTSQIQKNYYYETAVEHAQKEAQRGNDGLKRAQLFYEAVKTIENDGNNDTFSFERDCVEPYNHVIYKNGKIENKKLCGFAGTSDPGNQCMSGIIDLAVRKGLNPNRIKDTDLMKLYKQVQESASTIKEMAKDELVNKLDELI